MRATTSLLFSALFAFAVAGCSSSAAPTADVSPAPDVASESPPSRMPVVAPAASQTPAHETPPYTEAQVERGVEVFREVCADCHYRSELRGTQFQFEWRRRTVWDFYEIVTETMPEEDPGSLDPQQYIDVVAFVLSLNGFPAGEVELAGEQALLDAFSMAAPSGGTP